MGDKLLKYYDWLATEGGLLAQMKLAKETSIPSDKAAVTPDSPELVKKFQQIASQIADKPAPKF